MWHFDLGAKIPILPLSRQTSSTLQIAKHNRINTCAKEKRCFRFMYKVIQGFLKLYTIMQQNFCHLENNKYLYLGRIVCLSFAAHGCITIKSEILSPLSPDIDIQEPKTKKHGLSTLSLAILVSGFIRFCHTQINFFFSGVMCKKEARNIHYPKLTEIPRLGSIYITKKKGTKNNTS